MELAGSFRASSGADAGLPDGAGGSPPPAQAVRATASRQASPCYGRAVHSGIPPSGGYAVSDTTPHSPKGNPYAVSNGENLVTGPQKSGAEASRSSRFRRQAVSSTFWCQPRRRRSPPPRRSGSPPCRARRPGAPPPCRAGSPSPTPPPRRRQAPPGPCPESRASGTPTPACPGIAPRREAGGDGSPKRLSQVSRTSCRRARVAPT